MEKQRLGPALRCLIDRVSLTKSGLDVFKRTDLKGGLRWSQEDILAQYEETPSYATELEKSKKSWWMAVWDSFQT